MKKYSAAFQAARLRLLVVGVFGLFAANAWADDRQATGQQNCGCERYLQFATPVNLVDEFAAIGSQALGNAGAMAQRQGDLHLIERLRTMANEQIPERCRRWVAEHAPATARPPVSGSLLLRGQVRLTGDAQSVERQLAPNVDATERAGRLYQAYFHMYGFHMAQVLNSSTCAETDQECRLRALRQNFANFDSTLGSLSNVTESDRRALRFFHHMMVVGDIEQVLSHVRTGRDGLGEEEFLAAVHMLGIRGGSPDYNLARVGSGPESAGVLDPNRVLATAANNTLLNWTEWDPEGTSAHPFRQHVQTGGVCRDVAVTMAQLLEAKGFHNVSSIAYETSSGGHATVIAESYTGRGNYHLLNYGGRITRTGLDGGRLLYQGGGDATLRYRVYDAQGEYMGVVPSQLGLVLNEASGMNNSEWYPLSRTRGNFIAAGIGVGAGDEGQVRMYYANDGHGTPLIGAAGDAHLGNRDSWGELRVGGTIAMQARTPQTTLDGGSSEHMYFSGAIEGALRTPRLRPVPGFSVRGNVTGRWSGHYQVALARNGIMTDAMNSMNALGAGIESRYQPSTGGPSIETSAAVFTSIIGANLQGNLPHRLGPTVPEGRFRVLASAPIGESRVYAEGQLVADRMGVRGQAEVGVVHPRVGASVAISGRLDERGSQVAESTLRRVTGRVQVAPIPRVRAGVQVSVPIEQTGQATSEEIEAQGTLSLHFKQSATLDPHEGKPSALDPR